jgi:hypothetical protein
MTTLAVTETEIAAERSTSVMTRRARLSTRVDEVLRGRGRTHLPRLRRTRSELVTVSALEPLTRTMFGVTERVTKRARVAAGGPVRFFFVTHTTRPDLAISV